jgi:hypothetical protein
LSREPSFLLREELREVSNYYGVLTALARGISERKALAAEVALPPANVSFYLDQLIALGYVRKRHPLSGAAPSKRAVRYALADSLLRFWFRFVEEAERHAALVGAHRAVQTQILPSLDSYWGYCFEQLCRETLPHIYLAEGVTASYEVGEFWSRDTQIDVVGIRGDGVIDIGECKWGSVPSGRSLVDELEHKARHIPNPTAATIVRRAFLRRAKRGKIPAAVITHTLADLYAAQEKHET